MIDVGAHSVENQGAQIWQVTMVVILRSLFVWFPLYLGQLLLQRDWAAPVGGFGDLEPLCYYLETGHL